MAVNSDRKGKRIEREACKLLESFGYEARRSQQNSGASYDPDSADILTSVQNVRFEVKGGKNGTDIYNKLCHDWIDTARDETPDGEHWAILRKKDYQEWTIIFEMNGIVVQSAQIHKVIRYLETHNP